MDLQGKKIAVTGATGFLGRYIVKSLQSRGAHVIGVVRTPDRVPELIESGVEMRKADLADVDALARGFEGCDAIVSNAALFSVGNLNQEEHMRTNVQGTANVFDAAKNAGVKRVVHVSSVAVYRKHAQPRSDEDQPQLDESNLTRFNAYNVSKALSEQEAWRKAEAHGIDLTCVRPGPIYGAHDPNFMRLVRKVMWLPVCPVPVKLEIGLVYGGDVAEAIAKVLENNDKSIGKAYNTTGDDLPVWEFYRAMRNVGEPAPAVPIPVPVPIRRIWSNARAEADLGWSNRSFEEALRETRELEQ